MADLPSDPDTLVRQFCAAWANSDAAELSEYFADDAVYHNVPMDPCEGKAAIKEFLEGFFTGMGAQITFEIHHQVTAGGLVMNERTDTIVMGGNTTALPVAGVFEVADGRIQRWSDYFDLGQFTGG